MTHATNQPTPYIEPLSVHIISRTPNPQLTAHNPQLVIQIPTSRSPPTFLRWIQLPQELVLTQLGRTLDLERGRIQIESTGEYTRSLRFISGHSIKLETQGLEERSWRLPMITDIP
jgi:hypothetical protein